MVLDVEGRKPQVSEALEVTERLHPKRSTHIHGIWASKRISHMQEGLLTCSQAPFVNMNIVNIIKGGRWLKQPIHINPLSGQSRVVARLCNGFFLSA